MHLERSGLYASALLLTVLGILFVRAFPTATPVPHSSHASAWMQAHELLNRMTIEEKAGQMALVSVSRLWGDCQGQTGALNSSCLQSVLSTSHAGAILSGGGEAPVPNTPSSWATTTNAIQRFDLLHSRLHIPILYGTDAVHGHNNVLGATIFPHNIGLAATWEPALATRITAGTAGVVVATGVHWVFAPVADIARDVRWGRYYETFGEDPLLASDFVGAEVTGFQGHRLSTHVAATLKHFVGYSEPLNGHDRTAAELPIRYLRQVFFPSFQKGINAGAATVMVNSGSVNGVPVHASHYLLTTVLRHEMHFQGVVVSDWQDIEGLYTRYHIASSYTDAVRLAINAGVDMSMIPYDVRRFVGSVVALVHTGQISPARLNEAVQRILTLKFALGLFEHPYVDASRASGSVLGVGRIVARQAAEASMTLLKNSGHVLPLRKNLRSVLVVGPGANNVAAQMGGWTLGWQGISGNHNPPAVTILSAIRQTVSRQTRIITLPNTQPSAGIKSAARHADAAIVVVMEKPYAEGSGDTETDQLAQPQEDLVQTVASTGIPTIVVIVAGRPLIMPQVFSSARAVLMAWLPGTEGGTAVARVLFGDISPGGRLPVSWPRTAGAEPQFYTMLPGTDAAGTGGYTPLFPFGYGLTYTSFVHSHLQVIDADNGKNAARISVTIRNSGKRPGDDVIQLYAHPNQPHLLVPLRQLVAFRRVSLQPGQQKDVVLDLPFSRLAMIPGDIDSMNQFSVMPGSYTLSVDTQNIVLTIH